MKSAIRTLFFSFALVMVAGIPVSTVQAGADRFEWQAEILDYSDCTSEWVVWSATVRETMLDQVTPSGQGHIMDHWLFEGTVTGLTSGFVWSTKGVVKITETYSLDNSLTGTFGLLENALMKPVTAARQGSGLMWTSGLFSTLQVSWSSTGLITRITAYPIDYRSLRRQFEKGLYGPFCFCGSL